MQRFLYRCISAWFVLLLGGCGGGFANAPGATPRAVPTLRPTLAAAPVPAQAAPTGDTGWIAGTSGLEMRKLKLNVDERDVAIIIARLDLTRVRLRVGYAPSKPQTLDAWLGGTHPLLLINGGFFDQSFQTSALLVSDGTSSGTSYDGFGGMLTVASNGTTTIQPLRDQPYDPGQPFDQALQSFPMLVFPGGAAPGVEWNSKRDRRSALAFDRAGRLLVIACPQSSFTLNEFATWLRTSDLDIDRALNLDGGASTALFIDAGPAQERIDPFSRLPIVLYAEAR